jgi:hypothetical protein
MVKLGFAATVLSLISCSNDFPPAPEMKFCKFEGKCTSIHLFTEKDCNAVGGEIVNTCGNNGDKTGTE